MTTLIPTTAGPDTVCICGHWWEEHTGQTPELGDDPSCAGCDAAGLDLAAIEHRFTFDPEGNTPDMIADRGGDPDLWPEWVKAAYA